MTSRAMTAAMLAAIQRKVVYPALFYEGEFYAAGSPDAQYLRLWSGVGPVEWDGKTWTGGGHLLKISPLEESTETRAIGFSVTLSGLPSDKVSLALQSVRQGKPGKIWLGFLDHQAYLSLPGTAGNYASTPDSAASSVTGDIDIRVKVAMTDWTPATVMAPAGKWAGAGNQRSYVLQILTTGKLRLLWTANGSTQLIKDSTVATGFTDGTAHWVRATLDVDDGSGNNVVKFYTSDDGVTWTQLGSTVTTAGTTTIFDSTDSLLVGAFSDGSPLAGKVYYAEIRNGIDGTVVAKFDPTRFASGELTAVAETAETWTINRTTTDTNIVHLAPAIIADPYQLRSGRFDVSIIEDDGETATIFGQYEDRLIDLRRPRERRYTDQDQQHTNPGDLGFEFVPALQDMQLIWGGAGAASSPIAAPAAQTPTPVPGYIYADDGIHAGDNTGPGAQTGPTHIYADDASNSDGD